MEYYSSPKTLGINIKLFVFILRMNWSNNLSKKLQNYYDAMKRLLDSSRLVRIHSVGCATTLFCSTSPLLGNKGGWSLPAKYR
jgi:hypothetical protein